jgi:hypothetical protein
MMHLLFICHHINSRWQLKEVVKSWSMVLGPFWMPILIRWCFKLTLQTLSTLSVRPFSRNLEQHGVNCPNFSLLFILFMAFTFICTSVKRPFFLFHCFPPSKFSKSFCYFLFHVNGSFWKAFEFKLIRVPFDPSCLYHNFQIFVRFSPFFVEGDWCK